MKATKALHGLGQSIWLDNITRKILDNGTLAHYIDDLSVTGLTSNPTIFDQAIKNSQDYDAAILEKVKAGKSGEALFFELALEDLTRAAGLFRKVHDQTDGVDGFVSLEVSRCWHTTRPAPWRPQRNSTRARPSRIYSSKFQARRKVCRRSRNPSSQASRSTSLCCFRPISMSPPPKHICAAWSGGSKPD
jgi:hypothetical protein